MLEVSLFLKDANNMRIDKVTNFHVFIDEERKFTLTPQEVAELHNVLTEAYLNNYSECESDTTNPA